MVCAALVFWIQPSTPTMHPSNDPTIQSMAVCDVLSDTELTHLSSPRCHRSSPALLARFLAHYLGSPVPFTPCHSLCSPLFPFTIKYVRFVGTPFGTRKEAQRTWKYPCVTLCSFPMHIFQQNQCQSHFYFSRKLNFRLCKNVKVG
jgi:hypothetical protein